MPPLEPRPLEPQPLEPRPLQPKQVRQLIAADTRACETLLSLLEREQAALKSHDRSDLSALLADKQQCTAALEQGAQLRRQLLQAAGLAGGEGAWQRALQALEQRHGCSGLCDSWSALTDLLRQCRERNEINGKMITRGQQTMNRLLNLLRGQTAAPGLYDRAGGNTGGKGVNAHTVVKA